MCTKHLRYDLEMSDKEQYHFVHPIRARRILRDDRVRTLIYKWGNRSPERVRGLPQILQLVSGSSSRSPASLCYTLRAACLRSLRLSVSALRLAPGQVLEEKSVTTRMIKSQREALHLFHAFCPPPPTPPKAFSHPLLTLLLKINTF